MTPQSFLMTETSTKESQKWTKLGVFFGLPAGFIPSEIPRLFKDSCRESSLRLPLGL